MASLRTRHHHLCGGLVFAGISQPFPNSAVRIISRTFFSTERWLGHWGHDPWELDQGTGGTVLADGASFLLPYYMGLYHKYLQD